MHAISNTLPRSEVYLPSPLPTHKLPNVCLKLNIQQNAPSPLFFFWIVVVLTPWVRELSLQNPHEERDQRGNTTHLKCPPKTAQHSIRERFRSSYTAKRHLKFCIWNTFDYQAFQFPSAQISPTTFTQKHSTDCSTERPQRQNTAVNVQHLNSDMLLA